MRPIAADVAALITAVSSAKKVEPIVWEYDSGGSEELCIKWGPDFPMARGNLKNIFQPHQYGE